MRRIFFFKIIILVGITLLWGAVQFGYSQPQKLITKPFPKPPPQTGIWKILRFWTEPPCYTKLPHRDNLIKIKAIFECRGPMGSTCKDLTVKGFWHSSIEHVRKKEINLTRAVIDTCGPGATSCTVIWDKEKADVKIAPKWKRVFITTVGHISPDPLLVGDIVLVLEIFTGGKRTDAKKLIVPPCSAGEREPQGKPDLVVEDFEVPEVFRAGPDKEADIKFTLSIKNIGTSPSGASWTDVVFKTYPGGSTVYSDRFHVRALSRGSTYTINVFCRLPVGNYRVCAIADSTKVVSESNEGNNQSCRSFSVR